MSTALYVGIDASKDKHAIAPLSEALLKRYKRFEACPTFQIDNSRSGFEKLLVKLQQHAPIRRCHVLIERTGHYALALEQFLHDSGAHLYRITPKKRYSNQKTDIADARALAVILYNQIEKQIQVTDKTFLAQRLLPPAPIAVFLRGLVGRRYRLQQGCTRCKNRLHTICDQLFPELPQVLKDPNSPSALSLRLAFPTALSIAQASPQELYATRLWSFPGNAAFARLQELARISIGLKDPYQQRSLILQQRQLVDELRLFERQIESLDKELEHALKASREGQILLSFPGIGPVHASTILATIGSIANFESDIKLRSYFGWTPRRSQTGTSFDSTRLTKSGNRALKSAMRFIAMSAIKHDPRWKALHDRLVPLKTTIDPKTKKPRGLMKIVGRVAGDITGVIYVLLKRDYDLLASLPRGAVAPPPELYEPGRVK